ncbi:MAG: PKD domain-containing protein [Phycisphaerae bacterium]|nr:PKD domain-containing protein [Phycisphaerae bacterium]
MRSFSIHGRFRLVLVLLAAAFGSGGCVPSFDVGAVSEYFLYLGLEDELATAPVIDTFDGEWISSVHVYAVQITNRTGVLTLSNSLFRQVGDPVLVIPEATGDSFTGRQIFSDGSVYDVKGLLADANTLVMAGHGITWTMTRITPANVAPTVSAGANASITLAQQAYVDLNGAVIDDGLPAGSTVTTTWTLVSGPAAVTFGDSHALFTSATFTQAGTYVFQLEATDSEKSATSTVTVIVH